MNVREDILLSKERVTAFLEGKPIDRIPCMPIVTSNSSDLIGKTIKEFELDPQVMADSHIAAYNKYKYDLCYVFTHCSYVAEAMGQELVYYENEPASCEDNIIKSKDDLKKIRVAEKNDGKFNVFYDALDILDKEIGEKVFLAVLIPGAVSVAAILRGTENFAKDTYFDKELVHQLLRMSVESIKNFLREIVGHGAIPIIIEPIASGSIFSPKMFREFALPYIKELVDLAHELGVICPLHICGKTHKIIDLMAETGADILSIDICDLNLAKEKVAGRAVILGNISPANDLLFGTKEEIHEKCRQVIEIMKDYKPGFILGSGCEIPKRVSFDNIGAIVEAAKIFGSYEYK